MIVSNIHLFELMNS